MSIFSSLVQKAVLAVEAEEKTAIAQTVKAEIATLITTYAPATEADAVTIVNNNISNITNKAISGIKSPVLAGLAYIEAPVITSYIEGVADGLVSSVFTKAVSQVTETEADEHFQPNNGTIPL